MKIKNTVAILACLATVAIPQNTLQAQGCGSCIAFQEVNCTTPSGTQSVPCAGGFSVTGTVLSTVGTWLEPFLNYEGVTCWEPSTGSCDRFTAYNCGAGLRCTWIYTPVPTAVATGTDCTTAQIAPPQSPAMMASINLK